MPTVPGRRQATFLPGPAGPMSHGSAYCPMLAVDITSFSDRRRGEAVQRFLRAAMYDLLTSAFGGAHLTWPACHHEDRGDGVLVIAPPAAPAAALIYPLVDHLRAGIRRHNANCTEPANIRLRMSVHAGQVHFDEHGVCGFAVTHLFRLLDSAAFKRLFAASGSDFALVTSDVLFQEVISEGLGPIDPDMYAPINVRCKETRGRAWVYLPPARNPVLDAVNGQPRRPSQRPAAVKGVRARVRPAPQARIRPAPQARPAAAAPPAPLRPVGAAYEATPTIALQGEPPPQDPRRDRAANLAGRIAASARGQVATARKRAMQFSGPWPPARTPASSPAQ